ncbi:tumor necrosis factor ligand superfamily member 14 [Anolis carolinensis]|uniref:TNF superfamily member 14 n=1 Tax=Anolis carolinensis TaxID=28377 RepID=A0A803SYA8_ANOCA|nr:PREDICTED: tumor necrosis factor ligand superfamily member 14 [Anolis carolinensis]|eukprot:XP_008101908.1 PREDICTED: tumor necrosis factor ligand superfamily member 14 [Anolis carolinensis]
METGVGYPSVFVVDAPQRNVPFVPPVPKGRKKWQHAQLLLWVFMLLMLIGLMVQGYFLLSFRKELTKATTQGGAEAPTYEKIVQGERPPKEKPAAHLTLGALINTAENGALLWEDKKGLAFLQDMGYKDGVLIFNQSGHYYIYSKLLLGDSRCPSASQMVIHEICKRTSRYPREIVLLTNKILTCNLQNTPGWRHNSFLAGMVHLEENEEVFVKVSHKQMVRVGDDTRSYFGTFMI